MTRFLIAGAIAAAAAVPFAPAAQAVPSCDNLPVMVNCWTWRSGTPEHCDVWIKNVAPGCFNLEDIINK